MLTPDLFQCACGPPLWPARLKTLSTRELCWFPTGFPVVGEWQMPLLPAPLLDGQPSHFAPYDKRAGSDDPSATLLHGYTADRKLQSQLTKPHEWSERFEGFWGIVTPDFSMWVDDPLDLKVFATRMSRSIGAFHSSRGHRVLPTIRWTGPTDYTFCFDGITPRSAVSISNYGSWRDPMTRGRFLGGLPVMVEALEPSVVFVHGTTNHRLFKMLESKTEFVALHTRWASIETNVA